MILKRISNIDLYNKLNALENKLDIMIKQSQMNKNDMSIEDDVNIKISMLKAHLETHMNNNDISYILDEFKRDILKLFNEYTSSNDETYNMFNSNCDVILKQMCSYDFKLENNKVILQTLDRKLQDIYCENQIIKHQLHLQDELSKCRSDIQEVKMCISEVIEQIEKTIESKF